MAKSALFCIKKVFLFGEVLRVVARGGMLLEVMVVEKRALRGEAGTLGKKSCSPTDSSKYSEISTSVYWETRLGFGATTGDFRESKGERLKLLIE